MSDFNAKIVAIDLAMDAIEHYQRELSDLKAHISFDMRSLFDKLNQEIILTRNEIEGIQDRIDSAQAFIEADMHEGRSDCTTEIGLEELSQARGTEGRARCNGVFPEHPLAFAGAAAEKAQP